MSIMGAFLGGSPGAIPAGSANLAMQWTTNDGQNQQCTFSITGSSTLSVQSDANGFAEVTLPVGTYTVTPVHSGDYMGDGPKTITLESRGSYRLNWYTGALQEQTVTFTSPAAISSSTLSYSIKQGDSVVQSGTQAWQATMVFTLLPGDYTLELSVYGTSISLAFTVPTTAGYSRDLADQFCKVTASSSYDVRNITYAGYTVSGTSNYANSYSFYVLRSSDSKAVGATVETPTPPKYSGLSTSSVYTYSASTKSIVPNSASVSASIPVTRTGTVVTITQEGTLNIPVAGTYELLVIGGGGGGLYGCGGGGGRAHIGTHTLSVKGYEVTIGAGGKNGANGSATSFDTVASASGGNSANSAGGGTGGSGGGGGGSYTSNRTRYPPYPGGAGEQFGGGGSGAFGFTGENYSAEPGAGGTYGGSGGHGGLGARGEDGENGKSTPSGHTYSLNSTTPSGGSGGASTTNENGAIAGGGGGGGGGYGARGGNGGKPRNEYYNSLPPYTNLQDGDGGGGGGVAGGHGGDGKTYGTSTVSLSRGYGAGGHGGQSQTIDTGGGGGGGMSSTLVSRTDCRYGVQGAIRIQWRS